MSPKEILKVHVLLQLISNKFRYCVRVEFSQWWNNNDNLHTFNLCIHIALHTESFVHFIKGL